MKLNLRVFAVIFVGMITLDAMALSGTSTSQPKGCRKDKAVDQPAVFGVQIDGRTITATLVTPPSDSSGAGARLLLVKAGTDGSPLLATCMNGYNIPNFQLCPDRQDSLMDILGLYPTGYQTVNTVEPGFYAVHAYTQDLCLNWIYEQVTNVFEIK